ncbi:MAG: type 11 methyltransferase [Planctomycetota bacterium]|nr:MAG: type 11 methyltransferase [Planctomycetota bacterium]
MELNQLQYHWNGMGEEDPLFAVLTQPGKEQNRWQREEFLETGRRNIEAMLKLISEHGLDVNRGRALDFGCAVGRLTQALCENFDEVDGVDIAPSMLKVAREWNQHGERCRYHLNEENSLKLFEDQSFDFICTMITLQHMRPEYATNYIAEFARVLAPGGALLFQIPDQLLAKPLVTQDAVTAASSSQTGFFQTLVGRLKKFWTSKTPPQSAMTAPPQPATPSTFHMEMYCIPETDVVPLLQSLGLNVVCVTPNSWAGPHFISKTYLAQRPLAVEGREPISQSRSNLARAA